ncbi:MAG: response regulator transcription factor [Oceanospirillales bacterium]|uniref:Winged helix family two component transcriptional regulator n=1 Tax=Marinobacterium halophilum TaxID=267374 RepID=A0A2P8EWL5_9GAMM|nr:response regulator transcription factor [Marinobacterium halophilum]MBR9827512.1 response regulator transcription factor [Oceanospirillales bacterium]PSL13866.1 winged helix family two component transcriptional regulator [Marinobacterium halophilum]
MPTKPILLVDDDIELCALLADYLRHEGYAVDSVYTAEAALQWLEQDTPALMVLDVMMPGQSGLELLQQLRPRWQVPVLMLTGRGEAIDRILGLEMGADDYLAKPCNPRELLARIRAILRRSTDLPAVAGQAEIPADTPDGVFPRRPLVVSGIYLDPGMREARVGDQPLVLTSAEFNVLAYLMQHAGQVLGKAELTRWVLHRELGAYDRALDVHVSRVRQKLAQALGSERDWIKTVRGQGYQLVRSE